MYYIYIWYIKDTGEVFYVGRGHGNRYKTLKKRTKFFHNYFDNYDCESRIVKDGLTEEESIQEESEMISYYRSLGMAKANIHNGGRIGGDMISSMPEADRNKFIEKMTKINRERCGTDEFRSHISLCTSQRYANPEERRRQAERQKAVWTEEKRAEQRTKSKAYAAEHPDMVQRRAANQWKPCVLEFHGETFEFPSLKALKEYLWETYQFRIGERRKEQDMLINKAPFTTNRKDRKRFEGMKIYYTV